MSRIILNCARITADVAGNDDVMIVGDRDGFAWLDKQTHVMTKINHVWTEEDGPEKATR